MILDTATPMLFELSQVSKGYALDALNYASLKLQKKCNQKQEATEEVDLEADLKMGTDYYQDLQRAV